LALNATIEARGPAIPARLCRRRHRGESARHQTAKATRIFRRRSRRSSTKPQRGGGHQTIGTTIAQMSEIATAIAAAVGSRVLRPATSRRIFQEVSRGTSGSLRQRRSVNEAANETGAAATEVLTAADDSAISRRNAHRRQHLPRPDPRRLIDTAVATVWIQSRART